MRISDWSSDVCSSDLRYHLDMGDIARARQYFSQVEGQARRDLAEVEAETDGDPMDLANVLQDMADIELSLERTDAAVELTRRSEEHTSELQSLMRLSHAVLCLQKKQTHTHNCREH